MAEMQVFECSLAWWSVRKWCVGLRLTHVTTRIAFQPRVEFPCPHYNCFSFPTINRTAAPLTNLTIYPLFTVNLLSSVVPFCLLWPGFSVSMADAAEAAVRKVCHTCGVEKDIDQFRSFRGPRLRRLPQSRQAAGKSTRHIFLGFLANFIPREPRRT